MTSRDEGYVVSTWLTSEWPTPNPAQTLRRKAIVSALVAVATVFVAADPQTTTLHGWAAMRNGVLLHAYVAREIHDERPELMAELVQAVMG